MVIDGVLGYFVVHGRQTKGIDLLDNRVALLTVSMLIIRNSFRPNAQIRIGII